jgi:hypothetical protein
MARPKGTTKPDSLVFIKVVLGVNKETEEWYKSLPEGTKAKTMRDAINLYRSQQNQQTGEDFGCVLHEIKD